MPACGARCCHASASASVQGPAHVASFTCASCVRHRRGGNAVLAVIALAALHATRDALRQRVEAAVQLTVGQSERQAARRERAQRAQRAAARRAIVAHQLQKAVSSCALLSAANQQRDAALRAAAAKLAATRAETVQGGAQERVLCAQLQHRLVAQVLNAERQRVMSQLRQALPLHWTKAAVEPRRARAPDVPRYVRICGCVLPTDGDFSALSCAEVSAGLGMLLHFVTLAARYLGAPLLHQGSFRGSASTVWPRRSFNDDGYDGGASYPLYAAPVHAWEGDGERHGAAAAAAGTQQAVGVTVAAVGSWARGLGRLVLDSVDAGASSRDGSLASDAWATPGLGSSLRQAGLRMLHRSVGQLCAHELCLAGAPPPPPAWGPFALLAAVCAGLARPRPRDTLTPPAAAAFTAQATPALVRVQEADSDEDDWERVEDLLPPPPSCPDDVALWERYAPPRHTGRNLS